MNKVLANALRELRNAVAAGNAPTAGICGYIANHSSAKLYLNDLQLMWLNWPKHSGDLRYPVPAFTANGVPKACMHAQYAFGYALFDAERLWGDNRYGNARRELLDWSIATPENAHEH